MSKVLRVLVLAMVVVTALSVSLGAMAQDTNGDTMRLEIAEDGNRFVFDDAHTHEDGMPAYGTAFITQGYIYPEGTLNGSNGVLANGEPEFPELVIGEWTCYGYMIGNGMYTETGAWVVSTQVFQFNDSYDNAIITTAGFEIADVDEPVARAINGGTGQFSTARGEAVQTLLGFTEQMGVNLFVELDIQ